MALDQPGVDAQQLGLGLVRIRDHPTLEVLGRPGALGQATRQQPSRAGLGHGHRAPVEPFHDHIADRLPRLAVGPAPEALLDPGAQRLRGLLGALAVADVGDQLAAAQAGGDLQRPQVGLLLDLAQGLGQLGLGHAEHADREALVGLGSVEDLARRRNRQRLWPHPVQLARRARQHDHHHVPRRDDQARGGAGGVDGGRALGHHRLLAVGVAQGVSVEAEPPRELLQDRVDLGLHLLVQLQLAPGEAPHDLGGEVVRRGTEAAGGDDQVHPLVAHRAERRLQVLGAVAHQRDLRHLHPQLAQPLRDPWAVAVGDVAAQHLGAGDQDARSDRLVAHAGILTELVHSAGEQVANDPDAASVRSPPGAAVRVLAHQRVGALMTAAVHSSPAAPHRAGAQLMLPLEARLGAIPAHRPAPVARRSRRRRPSQRGRRPAGRPGRAADRPCRPAPGGAWSPRSRR